MIEIKKVTNKPLTFLERIYIVEIFRGFMLTSRHFFRNIISPEKIITVQYPEKKIPLKYAAKLRTRHRLKLRADGTVKCVACFLCATACPAYCIRIEAAEDFNSPVEKYPAVFDIDLSRCVMCGLCVEACPEDAIIMDTEIIPGAALKREDMLLTKTKLTRPHGIAAQANQQGAANRLTGPESAKLRKEAGV